MDKAAITSKSSAELKLTPKFTGLMRSLKRFFAREINAEETPMSAEKRALLKELDATLLDLRRARSNFDQATSPEIIEAAIYEIKSAESRYDFLLRRAKQLELTCVAFRR